MRTRRRLRLDSPRGLGDSRLTWRSVQSDLSQARARPPRVPARWLSRLPRPVLPGGKLCGLVSSKTVATERDSLSAGVARRVRTLARAKRASASRVIAELVESGLQAQEAERDRFLKLADELTSSKDPAEQEKIKEELARLTFGV